MLTTGGLLIDAVEVLAVAVLRMRMISSSVLEVEAVRRRPSDADPAESSRSSSEVVA